MSNRILIVDDVISNVMLLEGLLVGMGFDVITASSGVECLDKLTKESPDLILLDVMMPGLDGTEVCRRIKSNPATAHLPVVMVTALSQELASSAAKMAGADDCLVKPLEEEALLACIRKFVKAS